MVETHSLKPLTGNDNVKNGLGFLTAKSCSGSGLAEVENVEGVACSIKEIYPHLGSK